MKIGKLFGLATFLAIVAILRTFQYGRGIIGKVCQLVIVVKRKRNEVGIA